MPEPRKNILRRRPAESATGATGSLAAALIYAGVPSKLVPLIVLVLAWVPAAVTWLVEFYRTYSDGE